MFQFDHSYRRLSPLLFVRQAPVQVAAPQLLLLNATLAQALGLEVASLEHEGAAFFSGNRLPPGAWPLAQAYAGHQFGHFTMLGDGRAVLLGEQQTPDGRRMDIQLKGSGKTPFSRSGDGRAALGPMLREYIISESMHALGIPTTRSLAVVTTGETVQRDQPLPGAVLTRVAASHVRVGTFEYAARLGEAGTLRALADYAITRHYPELAASAQPYLNLLRAVMKRQAALVAQWMCVGFVHGVMNTDNMTISGETIDYGPCAFMDRYDPNTVFSSIDRQGRYAYRNQPAIAQWNLTRFAETLLPLLAETTEDAVALAEAVLGEFGAYYQAQWLAGMRAKLGLALEEAGDATLVQELLDWMETQQVDYTGLFRRLSEENPATYRHSEEGFEPWRARWHARLLREAQPIARCQQQMRERNPAVIPRNHRVEEALVAANAGDMGPTHRLLAALSQPYAEGADAFYRDPPAACTAPYRTFCGT